ncbi:AI-2E family transporter [Methylocystis sp. SC2]|uniref:AI-2E family transporter n=1 Tax=Methylocystis sp. (strain SC2) TaxID=187303 RepID=UPI00027AE7BA|nr:AI-2E family transporter [Methylocystis sp. SC2]CCJ09080.1 Putative permease [Methylocystis sp. SC2]
MKINFLTKSIDQNDFASRTAVVAMIAAATGAVVFILWQLTDLLPAVFATILIALAWRGVAERVSRLLGLSQGVSLAMVALGSLVAVVVALMLFGGQLVRQYDEVALDIPAAIAMLERLVEEHPWGRFVEKFVVHVDFSKMTTPVAQQFGALLGSVGSGLGYGIFTIIGAAYLAADPGRYAAGVIALAPASRRADMALFLDRSGAVLRQWLFIQLYVVAMNALFAGAALWAFGVPAPLALATISGALAFVPYFGSIIAMIIGVLVALPHGLDNAALAALAIGSASFVEGYLITPYLQSRSLMVPPVVLLFCMLAFASLFGTMGVVLAVPATVVLAVAYGVFAENR